MKYEKELNDAIKAIELGAEAMMDIYLHTDFTVTMKSDNSPVTEADKLSERLIKDYLFERYPTYGFLAEEEEDDLSRLEKEYVWIIDPLDGTKNFIARDDEFTINVALCYHHEIVLALIYIPAKKDLYWAMKDEGSYHRVGNQDIRIHVSDRKSHLRVLTSVFHFNDIEEALIEKHMDQIDSVEKCGSSIKACYVASGLAELSYRMNPNTKEWDTAPAQLLIKEAGGVFLTPSLKELSNNREDVYNREGYVIANCLENVLL
ncbi:MAG: 3'(2'),5'-bisphosphate nucleotidase CysQ [Coprobacillus sp.]|nr:3'(2'),5'-bisphosphate nucleotidase CysQ [Coprobacillus sp.]